MFFFNTSSDHIQLNIRRRSDTTISSYNDVPTPQSKQGKPFQVLIKPVSGPTGPHLFRFSQVSAEFAFDSTVQTGSLETKVYPEPEFTTHPQSRPALQRRPSYSRTLSPIAVNLPGLPSNVHDWTTRDVVDWMFSMGTEIAVIERFEVHDVSGTVLVEMDFEDLKELGIPSFGKRHQVWNSICSLKGGDVASTPRSTPFQDISRPCTNACEPEYPTSAVAKLSSEADETLPSQDTSKKRRRRRHRHQHRHADQDDWEPAETASIIAIEQHLPHLHKCSKGENCPRRRRYERQLKNMQEGGWPVSPIDGGRVIIVGDPGNSATAPNIAAGLRRQDDKQHIEHNGHSNLRPVSDAVPSVVASSDVLGPDQLPNFALHEEQLKRLEYRDPQENVKQFLQLQHVPIPYARPVTPPLDMFPSTYYGQNARVVQRCRTAAPHEQLKSLPKLTIPRAVTASPSLINRQQQQTSLSRIAPSPCLSYTETPTTVYRYGTPTSARDVAATVTPFDPVARATSQSVPADMQFRNPADLPRAVSRSDWRRPSFAMPALTEREEDGSNNGLTHARNQSQTPLQRPTTTPPSNPQAIYGPACTHAGWMRQKRKTKLPLRHEWTDAHYRLHGTLLAMHASPQPTSTALDTIDVDDYSITCSPTSTSLSQSKLAAKIRSLGLFSSNAVTETKSKKNVHDPAAFAFQLVPELRRAKTAGGSGSGTKPSSTSGFGLGRSTSVRATVGGTGGAAKTHHFAVRGREERIEWMRDLMLAKAKGQREKGFEVRVNGLGV